MNYQKNFVIFLIIFFIFLANFSQAYYEKSNVLEINIGQGVLPQASFSLVCSQTTENSILLKWSGLNTSNVNKIELYQVGANLTQSGGSPMPSGSNFDILLLSSTSSQTIQSGSYLHSGLESFQSYSYYLKWFEDNKQSKTNPITCSTLGKVPQAPTILKIYPLGPRELYLTWKDNAVGEHSFIVQKIKVTPRPPTDINYTVGNNFIELTWKNQTNTEFFKGPFYHKIERSQNSDFSQSIEINTGYSTDPNSTNINFSYQDKDLESGDYYYRISTCSFLKVNLNRNNLNEYVKVCTEPVDVNVGGPITLSLNKKSGFLANIFNLFKDLVSKVGAVFRYQKEALPGATLTDEQLNNYFKETVHGYKTSYSEETRNNLKYSVFKDSNLEPNTVYLYRIQTVYPTGVTSDFMEAAAGKTLPSGQISLTTINVCLRNSLCGSVTAQQTPGGVLENQCLVNNDCRDVGTYRGIYQER